MPEHSDDRVYEAVLSVVLDTYGDGAMSRALAQNLSAKIPKWPEARDTADSRIDMIRLTCWHWFSGGNTAAQAARRIEDRLVGMSETRA